MPNKLGEYIVPVEDKERNMDKKFIGQIRSFPELIRCRDCKYCEILTVFGKDFPACTRSTPAVDVKADDYCSKAERKEE